MAENKNMVASLHQVIKTYGNVTALNGVDLAIPRACVVGVLGPNGAGKTTAVRLLLGMMRPNRGKVTVYGGDPQDAGVRTRIGAMLQVGKVPETLRVREHIQLFSSYYPHPFSLAESVAWAGLQGLESRLFGDLSGGQKQRLLFALAICGNPDLLILDEPTVGLDVESRRALWERVRALVACGKTIILTTHYLEEADALSDQIVVINKGSIIAQGAPHEIKSSIGGKLVRCRSALSAADVQMLPGVIQVRESHGTLEIQATDPDDLIRHLLARDPRLSGIEVKATTLDDAFLALTRSGETSNISQEVYQ